MQIVVTLDSCDVEALAAFWQDALAPMGYRRAFDQPPYLSLVSSSGPPLLLQQVPETKQGKNRMHLDLRVDDLDAETARLVSLGARLRSEEHTEHGYRWLVLADPEDNEFCVFVPPG